jgi:Holliday junction resolvase RusA-like endonuclease
VRFWSGIITGETCSKANSRRLVTHRKTGRPMFIKSSDALAYEKTVAKQVPVLQPMLEGRLRVHMEIFYASERPDLDPSLILDCLAGRVYRNDRQCRELHLVHGIDRRNPRAVILVEEIGAPLLEATAA